jgi:peptidoglycan biosynthesis protein MviN/MurJ (putative lipid II flippase)
MVVHRTALWVLLTAGSIVGALCSVLAERRAARPDRSRPAVERYVFGALTGVGIGMGVATLLLLAAAVLVRLEP